MVKFQSNNYDVGNTGDSIAIFIAQKYDFI